MATSNENELDKRQANTEFKLEGIEYFRLTSVELVENAQKILEILSYDLDAELFDQQPFLLSVKQLCLRSRFSRVRILLQNNAIVQKQGHRLVELVRKMPSSIEIRRPSSEYMDQQENFLSVDQRAYIRWNRSKQHQGFTATSYPLTAQRLSEFFNQIWQCSEPESELRRLYI